jgi:hypothetical protein
VFDNLKNWINKKKIKKVELHEYPNRMNIAVWFGLLTALVLIACIWIIIDPVFSDSLMIPVVVFGVIWLVVFFLLVNITQNVVELED